MIFYLICGFSAKVTCSFLFHKKQWRNSGENELFRLRFQGYRCKTDIVLFVWKVTWNYVYSPLNKGIIDVFILKDPPLPGVSVQELQSQLQFPKSNNEKIIGEKIIFKPRIKFKPRLKYGWFHLKLYSMFQDISRRPIETGFWRN